MGSIVILREAIGRNIRARSSCEEDEILILQLDVGKHKSASQRVHLRSRREDGLSDNERMMTGRWKARKNTHRDISREKSRESPLPPA